MMWLRGVVVTVIIVLYWLIGGITEGSEKIIAIETTTGQYLADPTNATLSSNLTISGTCSMSSDLSLSGTTSGFWLPYVKEGNTQAAAGAAVNEVWVDTDDDCLKLGK